MEPPNKSLQRTVNHKVLGRGREVSALWRAPSARVLTGQPAAAELSRWAACQSLCWRPDLEERRYTAGSGDLHEDTYKASSVHLRRGAFL
jgi:hypothetical protein